MTELFCLKDPICAGAIARAPSFNSANGGHRVRVGSTANGRRMSYAMVLENKEWVKEPLLDNISAVATETDGIIQEAVIVRKVLTQVEVTPCAEARK